MLAVENSYDVLQNQGMHRAGCVASSTLVTVGALGPCLWAGPRSLLSPQTIAALVLPAGPHDRALSGFVQIY